MEHNLAIDFDMTREDLEYIGTSESWRQQDQEMNRITNLAMTQREEMRANNLGTREDLVEMIEWVCSRALTVHLH